MSEQDILTHLKTIQGLLERSVNGNHQTHTLLEQLIRSIDRMVQCSEQNTQLMQQNLEALHVPKR